MHSKYALGLFVAAAAIGNVVGEPQVRPGYTPIDTAYLAEAGKNEVMFPGSLDIAQQLYVGVDTTSNGKMNVQRGVAAIAVDAKAVKCKSTVALDTAVRRIRAPANGDGKIIVSGTVQVAGAIRYNTPSTNDFPALPSFLEEGEAASTTTTTTPWTRVAKEDFSSSDHADRWQALLLQGKPMAAERTTCSEESTNHFLIGGCSNKHYEIVKDFDALPARHTEVRIKSKFHFIDAWNGEGAYMKVDGNYAWLTSHESPTTKGISLCGSNKFSDHKMNQPIDIILKHTGASLKLVFGSELKHQDGECNGSFGVDDVEIYVS